MSAIAQTPIVSSAPITIPDRTLLTGLALTSFAALLLELALTRLFSVVLFYHFAFLAISIALLGLGAGGVFAYLFKTKLAGVSTRKLAAYLCIANALMVPAVLETVLHVPVALEVSSKNFLHLTALYMIAAVTPVELVGRAEHDSLCRRHSGHRGSVLGPEQDRAESGGAFRRRVADADRRQPFGNFD